MKSLVIKDLFNIGHNMKTMLMMLIVLAFALLPTSGMVGFISAAIVICCMMVITTFSFDDMSKWDRYALILPIQRKDVVKGKYIVLFVFTLIGLFVGVLFSAIASTFLTKLNFKEAKFGVAAGLILAFFASSIIIPLIFKYGAEKARMLMMLCLVVPTILAMILQKMNLLNSVSIFMQKNTMMSGVIIIAFLVIMLLTSYFISCHIYEKKEIN